MIWPPELLLLRTILVCWSPRKCTQRTIHSFQAADVHIACGCSFNSHQSGAFLDQFALTGWVLRYWLMGNCNTRTSQHI